MNHRAVASGKPPAPYQGGKRHLAKRLCARIAQLPHHTYVEPFVGMGGVFFRRAVASPAPCLPVDMNADYFTH